MSEGHGGIGVMELPTLRLVRPDVPEVVPPVLDESQQRVVDHRGGPLLVLAGPGTGKTTTLVEAVVDRVNRDGLRPEQVLVLTFSRRAAAELRIRIAHRLRRTIREPVARTFHSYAFGLLRQEAVLRGDETLRLLSSAEQDVLIRELLRGDIEAIGADYWPEHLRPALLTRGFAAQLRDLLMRATERGVSADRLATIGRQYDRADWVAAARFAEQYAGVTALQQPPSYDQAELVRAATGLLRDDPELLERERAARVFVVVDEYQDSDPAQEELLGLLAGGGRDLLVVGDPDQSIYGFRGAEVEGIREFPDRFRTPEGEPASVRALKVSRRSGPRLLEATRRIAVRLGGPPAHRQLTSARTDAPGAASVHVFSSASQEAAFIAAQLRSAHLIDGVPWESMAVLVRTGSAISIIRRALSSSGVPVEVRREDVPLVEQPPVRALNAALEVVTDVRNLDAELAAELITGPMGGADTLGLRRLRQELRWRELESGGTRSSGELVAAALMAPALLEDVDQRVVWAAKRVGAMLESGRRAAERLDATAEEVLWAMWSSTRLEWRWAAAALSGGPGAGIADRNLDAVVGLFDSVARYVDRMPGAGPEGFLEYVRDQQIPSDTMHSGAPQGPAVTVLTAHAAKGLEWDVVAVAGVQEGVWPDIRERGSLLGADLLLDVVANRNDSEVTRASGRLAEERRLFYVAATRAAKRLYVTAVSAEDDQPSRFLDELDPARPDAPPEREVELPGRSLDLSSLVAELRSIVCDVEQPDIRRQGAAAQLARLAAFGITQAHPDRWYGYRPLSVDAALGGPDQPMKVSPSKVEEFNKCELRWLLKACGASDMGRMRASIGTLVHDLAERASKHAWSIEEMLAELEKVWPSIDVGEGWAAAKEYARAREMVERLAGWIQANPRQFLGAEVGFDVTVNRARLVGRVDRLDADQHGHLVVVDFKTGKSGPTEEQIKEHPQLAAYQLAVELGGFDAVDRAGAPRSGGASLVQLGRPKNGAAREQFQPPLADAENPDWARELVEDTARGMAQVAFRAQRGQWCGHCPARPSCPVWPEGEQVTS